jgi:hypothetical protein
MVTSCSGAETSSNVPRFSTSYPCGLFQTKAVDAAGSRVDLASGDLPPAGLTHLVPDPHTMNMSNTF